MKVLYQGWIPPFDVLLVVMFQSAPVFRKFMLECLEAKQHHMCQTWQSKFGKMLAFGDAGLKVFRNSFTLFVTFLQVQSYFKTEGLCGSSVSVCVRGDTHTGSHAAGRISGDTWWNMPSPGPPWGPTVPRRAAITAQVKQKAEKVPPSWVSLLGNLPVLTSVPQHKCLHDVESNSFLPTNSPGHWQQNLTTLV